MAHLQQIEYCKLIKFLLPQYFRGKVLDVGSLDVNGNNRYLFDNCEYVGADIAAGKNVDLISKGHEINFSDNTFDFIISTECFEHDMFYHLTIPNIVRMLKHGGMFLFTCAAPGRPEHGTLRTDANASPLTCSIDTNWANYYKNLSEEDIRKVINIEDTFCCFSFTLENYCHDLQFFGIKK